MTITIITKEYYDSKGNHIKTLYSNNAYKKYEYDLANKIVTTTSYNSKGTQTGITKSYEDRKGNVIKSIDYTVNDKTITPLRYSGYEYDFLGRKIAEYEIDGTEAPTNEQKVATKISYTYDVDGNVKTVTYGKNSDIKRLTYNYNDFGWLTNIKAIVVKGQGEKEVIVREYKYNSNGTVREMKECTDILNEAVNYITKTYTYDSFCRVSSMVYMNANGKQVETYSYSYDKNSNIVRKNVQYGYSKVDVYENKQYVYNELGQLVETISSNKEGKSTSTFYKYDVVGNRIEMIDNKINCTTKYEYNDLNQLLSSTTINNVTKKETSKIKYAYDQNGNQISKEDAITKESVSYEYDVENRLVNVSGKKTDGTSYTQENRYNGSGQRIYKRDMEIGATTKVDVTRYYYQDGMVAYTTNESGNLKTFNYYGVDNNIIGSTRYNSGNVEYYLYNKDIQGSTTNILDKDGDSSIGYTYDDFGTANVYSVKNNVHNEITYTGAVYDNSTGLYYMNARYYDSESGRFISQDTYRGEENDARTWHLYAYCANNPINYVDPSGHFLETILDFASLGHSIYSMATKPSWSNLCFLAWDTAAVFVPFAPGSYAGKVTKYSAKTAKTTKYTAKVASRASDLRRADSLILGSYKSVKKQFRWKRGVEVHHIIEKRMIKALNVNSQRDILSIPLSKDLHRKITNRWRREIAYGTNYKNLSKKRLLEAVSNVYKDMPQLKHVAIEYVKQVKR